MLAVVVGTLHDAFAVMPGEDASSKLELKSVGSAHRGVGGTALCPRVPCANKEPQRLPRVGLFR